MVQWMGAGHKSKVKWGLAEAQRRGIYIELWRAERRANREAKRRCPPLDPLNPGYTNEKAVAQAKREMDLSDKLYAGYKAQVLKKHGVTEAQGDAILVEGVEEKWAEE